MAHSTLTQDTLRSFNNDPQFSQRLLPIISTILEDLCEANDKVPAPYISKFQATVPPPISISDYLGRIAQFAECSNSVFVLALIYIDKVQQQRFIVHSLNIHRLLITSIMLAAKFIDDAFFTNKFYAQVGGISAREINDLELEFLFMVGFNLHVLPEEYDQYAVELENQYTRAQDAMYLQQQQMLSESSQALQDHSDTTDDSWMQNAFEDDMEYDDMADPSSRCSAYSTSYLEDDDARMYTPSCSPPARMHVSQSSRLVMT